jgi:peroxiredoxin
MISNGCKTHTVWLALLVGIGLIARASVSTDVPATLGASNIANFTLVDMSGKPWSLYDQRDKKAIVLVFVSSECPMSNGYLPVLAELAKTYAPQGVAFVAVNANPEEKVEQIAAHAKEFPLPFPLLRDAQQTACKALGATVNPEAFVLDGSFRLQYRGRIDDGYYARLKPNFRISRHDLREAIDEVIAGKQVSVPATKAIGCTITLAGSSSANKTSDVTYYRDVLPVLQNNCQTCHRPGEAAPFSLMTYHQARKWAEDIKEYTQTRKMPPWKPVDCNGLFQNERQMSDADIATLARWVDQGMAEGDPKDSPPPRQFVGGWQLGEPDLVLEAEEEVTIGPAGRDAFRVLVFPTHFDEDRYVTAVEVRPGNKRVVHHTVNVVDTTGQARKLIEAEKNREKKAYEQDSGPGYPVTMGFGFLPVPPRVTGMGGWAPGLLLRPLPEGVGYPLPKGGDLVVQFHYHRTGKVEKDRTRIGLHLAKKPVSHRNQPVIIPGRFISIPAGADNYEVHGQVWVEQDIKLLTVMPHMHLLGKSIKATMTLPDGATKTLIDIRDWDYNWQEVYYLNEPMKVPAGTRFDVVAHYDNSDKNPLNPSSPPQSVAFGEQTTNEMCFVFLGVTTDNNERIRQRFAPAKKENEK